MTTDYRRIAYQKEMMWKEINEQCARYDNECVDYPVRRASEKEIADMLRYIKDRKCSYT